MLMFSLTLILGAITVGSCSAQESNNYLKVKGEILNGYNANIVVYTLNADSDQWEEIAQRKVSKKYRLRLATDKDYLVLFVNDDGDGKAMKIKSGDPGTYLEYVDINFDNVNDLEAYLYQSDEYTYAFSTEPLNSTWGN